MLPATPRDSWSKSTLAKWFGIGILSVFMLIMFWKLVALPWHVDIKGTIQIETLLVLATGLITAVIAWFGYSQK